MDEETLLVQPVSRGGHGTRTRGRGDPVKVRGGPDRTVVEVGTNKLYFDSYDGGRKQTLERWKGKTIPTEAGGPIRWGRWGGCDCKPVVPSTKVRQIQVVEGKGKGAST